MPRGGLGQFNLFNNLRKSGTVNLPISSLCFLARVSHLEAAFQGEVKRNARRCSCFLGGHLRLLIGLLLQRRDLVEPLDPLPVALDPGLIDKCT